MTRLLALAAIGLCGFFGCSTGEDPLEAVAERYIELAWALDAHDSGYVDAYIGTKRPDSVPLALEAIEDDASRLLGELGGMSVSSRTRFLVGQLTALHARTRVLRGASLSFDEELEALYGAALPPLGAPKAQAIHARLDELLPGDATLLARYTAYQRQTIVAIDELDALVTKALEACRHRTLRHVKLPEGERVDVEYVRGKPWAAYHVYHGALRSVVQINQDVAWTPRDVLESVCHESYPGHHTLTVLAETELVRRRSLKEFSVQTLHSPYGWRLEALASQGAALALDDGERNEVDRLARCLRPVAADGARRYLEGRLDRVGTVLWLEKHALMPDAWGFLRFVDRYRGYVMAYADRPWSEADDPWKRFGELARGEDEVS